MRLSEKGEGIKQKKTPLTVTDIYVFYKWYGDYKRERGKRGVRKVEVGMGGSVVMEGDLT